jgi:hypothetical protein
VSFGIQDYNTADLYKNYADFLLQNKELPKAEEYAEKANEIIKLYPESIGFFEIQLILNNIDELKSESYHPDTGFGAEP